MAHKVLLAHCVPALTVALLSTHSDHVFSLNLSSLGL
jgi:hypothetical protein